MSTLFQRMDLKLFQKSTPGVVVVHDLDLWVAKKQATARHL